jgi:NhaP-type Na+/H+ or K+/H+ antiporter
MTDSPRPKAVFTYCFQVWITGLILAPAISLIWAGRDFVGEENWWSYEIFMIIYGFLFSVLALLLFSGGAAALFRLKWKVFICRWILSFFGTLLTMSTFGIVFHSPFSIHLGDYPGSLCYILPSVAGVWLYRWPGRIK